MSAAAPSSRVTRAFGALDLRGLLGPTRAATFDRALVVLVAATLEASAIASLDLFRTLATTLAGLAVAYAAMRPALAVRAFAWCRANRRGTAAIVLAAMLLTGTAAEAELLRHPAVDASGEAALWTQANLALDQVVAADLRWQAAPAGNREGAVIEVRRRARAFLDAVSALERAWPPVEAGESHAVTVAIYREMADLLLALPEALARGDTDRGATIWTQVGVLGEEAAAMVRLTQAP